MTPQEAFDEALKIYDPGDFGNVIGVAISGGSDSTALLHLAQNWAKRFNCRVHAVTVDHGLRPGAAQEAQQVRDHCQRIAVEHDILTWSGWDRTGNLQSEARDARYRLMEDWAQTVGINLILVGHTSDDQAETVLMALARGSGVDGLAGMKSWRGGVFYRPLLNVSRDALRKVLTDQEIDWIDDPSNEDPRFDRVKARQMMGQLAKLGLSKGRLLQTSAHMSRAQVTLGHSAFRFARDEISFDGADLIFPSHRFDPRSSDTDGRVLAAAIQWFSGQSYRPRFAALCEVAEKVRAGERRTFGGVILNLEGHSVRLARERQATESPRVSEGGELRVRWDHRWQVSRHGQGLLAGMKKREMPPGVVIGSLGERISEVKHWKASGLPRASLMATPAIFDGDRLIAAPVAGLQNGWSAQIVADFHSFLQSH